MHGIRLQSCWWYRLASLWNLGIARLGCLLARSSIVQFHPGELLSNVYILTTPSAASLLYTSSISTYPTRKILIIIVISTYVLYLFYHYQISSRQIKQCVIGNQIIFFEVTTKNNPICCPKSFEIILIFKL